MSHAPAAAGSSPSQHDRLLFWGCFIALITTAFGFIARMFLINTWAAEFGLDPAQAGRLAGIGIWPFAVSIIGFSLIIDKIGYKVAMVFAFLGHVIWAIMGVSAYFISHDGAALTTDPARIQQAFSLIYWGSLILALGNGTVEAFINPVVATMFSREKTKWLNILHAGWPGGLVLAGVITIYMGDISWGVKVGIIALPAVIYFIMLIPLKFPVHERVSSGVTYRQMLSEFGILGAIVAGFLITLQLMDFFAPISQTERWVFIAIGVAIVAGFGLYTRALGRGILFFLVLIMIPLATTEIGTDGWITGIMEGVFEMTPEEVAAAGGMENVLVINDTPYRLHPGWVLVYTSVIMMVLRFFAGPIVHTLSPLGLLAASAALAIAGLAWLAVANPAVAVMIFAAATIYAFGKTFFWPTMLGVVAEQTPRGGALTLNAISGLGMLAVGTLGFPYIGALQADKQIDALVQAEELHQQVPGLVEGGELAVVEKKTIYEIIPYQTVSQEKIDAALAPLPPAQAEAAGEKIEQTLARSNQRALANMAVFPAIMLAGYIILLFYFKSRGGYQAQVLAGHAAEDEKFTGGVEAPIEA